MVSNLGVAKIEKDIKLKLPFVTMAVKKSNVVCLFLFLFLFFFQDEVDDFV